MPDAAPGRPIDHLPKDVAALRTEARSAFGGSAYTASVMTCRKILMHVAVEQKADAGERFAYYVKFLHEKHWIPPGAKAWVDKIRTVANEANHEITIMGRADAVALLYLTDMLLQHVYELPNKAPPTPKPPTQ